MMPYNMIDQLYDAYIIYNDRKVSVTIIKYIFSYIVYKLKENNVDSCEEREREREGGLKHIPKYNHVHSLKVSAYVSQMLLFIISVCVCV